MKLKNLIQVTVLTVFLVSCGSSSSDSVNQPDVPEVNNPPIVTPVEPPNNVELPPHQAKALVAPINLPDERKIKKSAIWYTYGGNSNMSEFDDFGANGVFWGHMPQENLYNDNTLSGWINTVNSLKNKGLNYTARGEFDWGWKWFIEFEQTPDAHYVKNLNGESVLFSFMGILSYQNHPNGWLSNNSPLFVPFLKSQVDRMFEADIDYIMFDSQTSSTRSTHMNQFGGDFSPYTMDAFRGYLDNKYTMLELEAKGVDNISTFDYRLFLIDRGYTHTSYMSATNRISGGVPLFDDFVYFNRDVLNEKMEEVFTYIRETDADIEIGSTTSLMEPRGYIYSPDLTFLAGELPMDTTTIDEMPITIVTHLKAAEAVEKTLVYFPYPWNFNSLRERNAPKHARTWIAQSYAMGAIFSIPANVWVGDSGVWQPGADNYRDLYQLVRDNADLFEGYKPYSKVGLVSPVMASLDESWLNGSANLQNSIEYLLKNNLNFDLLIFGDPGTPVMPTQAKLDSYDTIVVDNDESYLTTEQAALISANSNKVIDINNISASQLATLQSKNIMATQNGVDINNKVNALSRISTTASAPYVLQLLNRPLNSTDGSTPVLDNVMLTIPSDYFPENIQQAILHLPGENSENLTVIENSEGDYELEFDGLGVWGIIELVHN